MSTRRGFFALIGNAAVTGLVMHRASAAKPTLILPSTDLIEPSWTLPPGYPLLRSHETHMHAFLRIREALTSPELPVWLYPDWLEGGLRQVEGCKKPGGQIWRAWQIEQGHGDPLGDA